MTESHEFQLARGRVVAAIATDDSTLGETTPEFQTQRATVYAAVQKYGQLLEYASPKFKNDRQIVLAAVQQNGYALKFASQALQQDRDLVLAAVQQSGYALEFASPKLKNDKPIVLEAVKHNFFRQGQTLQFVSEELRNDKEVVLAGVQKDGMALQYASPALKKDRDLVLAAVQNHGQALRFASAELKKDRDLVLAAVRKDGMALESASLELQNDREVVEVAIVHSCHALQYAGPELKNDKNLILKEVQKFGWALKYASPALKNDPEMVLTAVQHDDQYNKHLSSLQYASEALKNDKGLILAAIQHNGQALRYAHPKLQRDTEMVLTAVKQDLQALYSVSEALKYDPEFVLAVVQHNGLALQYFPEVMKNNADIVLAAVKQNRVALQYASPMLKNDPHFVTAIKPKSLETLKSSQHLQDHSSPTTSIQVVILCAKFDEAEQLCQVFHHLQLPIREAYFHNIIYDQTVLTDSEDHVLVIDIYSCASRSGSVITAAMASEILHRSKPHWLFMTGVCAGNPNKVHLGDLLIAERVFDLRQGKAVVGQILGDLSLPTINIRLEDPILRTAKAIQKQKDGWQKLIPAPRPMSPRYKKEVLRWMLYQRRRELISRASTGSDISGQVGDLALDMASTLVGASSPAPGDQSGQSLKEIQALLGQSNPTTWAPKECANLLLRMSQATPPQIMYCHRSYKYYLTQSQEQEINNLLGQQEQYPELDPVQPETHLGVMATDVSAVRADLSPRDWEEMAVKYHQRNLIGLEMEGYGLYETVKSYNETHHDDGRPQVQVILMKGVSDVGDPEKEDQFHAYGKQISGGFVYEFLRKYGYQLADKKNRPAAREEDEKKTKVNVSSL